VRREAQQEARRTTTRNPFLRNVGDLTLQGRVDLTENTSVGLLAFRVVNVKNSLGRARWREREKGRALNGMSDSVDAAFCCRVTAPASSLGWNFKMGDFSSQKKRSCCHAELIRSNVGENKKQRVSLLRAMISVRIQ
jgi:hypothetical protein